MSDHADTRACSFCSKTKDEVLMMVSGPMVYICNGCIGLSIEAVILHGSVDDAATFLVHNLGLKPGDPATRIVDQLADDASIRDLLSVIAHFALAGLLERRLESLLAQSSGAGSHATSRLQPQIDKTRQQLEALNRESVRDPSDEAS